MSDAVDWQRCESPVIYLFSLLSFWIPIHRWPIPCTLGIGDARAVCWRSQLALLLTPLVVPIICNFFPACWQSSDHITLQGFRLKSPDAGNLKVVTIRRTLCQIRHLRIPISVLCTWINSNFRWLCTWSLKVYFSEITVTRYESGSRMLSTNDFTLASSIVSWTMCVYHMWQPFHFSCKVVQCSPTKYLALIL